MEAQLALAEAEIDSGNLTEAEAAAERAIKANPNAIDALIFKGRAKMAVAVANKAPAADWTKIRQVFVAANRLDPDDPEPLILFYQSYFAQGIAPTQNAAVGIKRALELAPQDFDLRFSVARQYLVEGDATQARRTLVPVAYNPHQDDATKAATAIIAQLDAGKSDEALKNWVSTIESERADDD
jgi:cytochrome c-type biogenesis protein CcmH/NrfG